MTYNEYRLKLREQKIDLRILRDVREDDYTFRWLAAYHIGERKDTYLRQLVIITTPNNEVFSFASLEGAMPEDDAAELLAKAFV